MVAATERLLHERVPGIIAVDRVGQPEPEVLIASPEAAYTNQASAAQAG